MFICASKLGNDWFRSWFVAYLAASIIWTNAGLLLIGPLGMNFSDIWIKMHEFLYKDINLECLENGIHVVSASVY